MLYTSDSVPVAQVADYEHALCSVPHLSIAPLQVVACRARGPAGLNLLVDEEDQDQGKATGGDTAEEVERFELDEIEEIEGMLFDRNDVAECLKVIF